MSGRNDEALTACQEAEKRAGRTPNPIPIALARLCSCTGKTIPRQLQAVIANLHNPELTSRLEHARAAQARQK